MFASLRNLVSREDPIIGGWLGLGDPDYCAYVARAGFDFCVLDMQHGLIGEDSVRQCISAITRAGKPALVRVAAYRADMIEKVLDSGALGVIVPMINSMEEARTAVASAKFPPLGNRSFGSGYAPGLLDVDPAGYLGNWNEHAIALAMVETKTAFDALDGILDVPGLDGVFFGPTDFSISLSGQSKSDPFGEASLSYAREIVAKTKAAGLVPSCFTSNTAHTRLALELGFECVTCGLDASYIAAGVAQHLSDVRAT